MSFAKVGADFVRTHPDVVFSGHGYFSLAELNSFVWNRRRYPNPRDMVSLKPGLCVLASIQASGEFGCRVNSRGRSH